MNTIAVIIAGVLSGALGAMGLGGGGVLILYLTLVLDTPQLKAQGMNLMFFLPCALTAVIIYAVQKKISFRALLPFLLSGIPGVLAGTAFSGIVGAKIVAKLFGAGLIFMGIREIFTKPQSNKSTKKQQKN